MPVPEIVVLRNPSDTDYVDSHADRTYRVPAQNQITVTSGPLHEWLGDPDMRLVGNEEFLKNEVRRLRARYGAYENDEVWDRQKPPLEAWTVDGERIYTLVDNPHGNEIAEIEYGSDTDATASRIAILEQELASMRAAMASSSTLASSAPEPQVPVPPATPRAARKSKATDSAVHGAIVADLPIDTPDRQKIG